MDDMIVRRLTSILWPNGKDPYGAQVHWLLDGARDPAIASLVRMGTLEYACLFSGKLHSRLQAAAPYLVKLSAGSEASNHLLTSGWGKAWGILTVTAPQVTLGEQRLHLKKLLRVRKEDGTQLAFRYYDPRVLKIFLPTCTSNEAAMFFGPITRLLAESGDGASVHAFERSQAGLRCDEHVLT